MIDVARESATLRGQRNRPATTNQRSKFPRKEFMELYGLEGLEKTPREFFKQFGSKILRERRQRMGVNSVHDNIIAWLENKGMRVSIKTGAEELTKDLESIKLLKTRWKASIGVLGYFLDY